MVSPLVAMQWLLCRGLRIDLFLNAPHSQVIVGEITPQALSRVLSSFVNIAAHAYRSTLGNRSLSSESYTPDFTAVALNSAPFRMLRISRSAYRAALEATQLSPVVGYQVHLFDMH